MSIITLGEYITGVFSLKYFAAKHEKKIANNFFIFVVHQSATFYASHYAYIETCLFIIFFVIYNK